jgi:thioredoxin reductase
MMDIPVLIVGGGAVALAASIALSRCGVMSVLVERHSGQATLIRRVWTKCADDGNA